MPCRMCGGNIDMNDWAHITFGVLMRASEPDDESEDNEPLWTNVETCRAISTVSLLTFLCAVPTYAQRGGGRAGAGVGGQFGNQLGNQPGINARSSPRLSPGYLTGGIGAGAGSNINRSNINRGNLGNSYYRGRPSGVPRVYSNSLQGYRTAPNFYGTRGALGYGNPLGYGLGSPGISLGFGIYGPSYGSSYGYLAPSRYRSSIYGPGLYGLYSSNAYYPSYLYGAGVYRSISGYPYYGSGQLWNGSGIQAYYPPAQYDLPLAQPPARSTTSVPARDDYLQTARAAFLSGDYARAQRMATHAVVESPETASLHELLSLTLFAQGEYRGAADAAHAAADLAPVADWPTLYRYYNDKEKYTQHLRALERFVKDTPDAIDGLFLLGIHRMMLGQTNEAKKEFDKYLRLVPQDTVAAALFTSVGGTMESLPAPPEPPAVESPAIEMPAVESPAVESPAVD